MFQALKRLVNRLGKRAPRRGAVRFTPDGFDVAEPGEPAFRVRWAAVEEVYAYKRDHVTVDCICLGFRRTDGQAIEVSEEDSDYAELVRVMKRAFLDHKADWWSTVAFPAFDTSYTVIWNRPGANSAR